ncbi:MAG: endonuclease III [Spirochaetes bacterium]|nr:endonuclease III [Spirochaetota bacterium]
MTESRADTVFRLLHKHYGTVKPGLEYSDIYQLTIAVVLSAQTTDKQVNKITPVLFSKYPDFCSLQSADITEIEGIVKSTGFFRTKASNIVRLARCICLDYDGKVPDKIEELIKLPGVGRKSANVILAQGHNIPGLAVDTHVKRLSQRLGLSTGKEPDKIEKDLKNIYSEKLWSEVHLLLIHHGRNKCHARKPECITCPVRDLCNSPDKNF